ncbi:hypothetical protein VIN30_01835 [Adlercreutzia sp. R7]|uniref:LemA family protein n=1 Tax=Adlercreutzia wanghongyangiae TaxID=3111451 RepID=A0ABU6IFH4_9ACTN|nr:hypothetical protein [Adlercreutzia sp. R7]
MARKKINHAAHIKSHTQGSSNEISFSVLDAAREARDAAERDRRGGASSAGGVSLFTLGAGKKPRATPEKEQHIVLPGSAPRNTGRSAAPRHSSASAVLRDRTPLRFVPTVVGVCVVIALVLTVGQTVFQMRAHQSDLRSVLAEQIAVINQADEVVIPFDELVVKQYGDQHFAKATSMGDSSMLDQLSDSYRALVGDIAPVYGSLQDAVAAIEEVQPSLSDNDDKEAARQALAAAQARMNMFDTGISIVDEALMATEAYEAARSGWKDIIDADAAAREATAALEEMTEDTVRASTEKTNTALTLLNHAADQFDTAQGSYPGLDLSLFSTYVAKRIEAQQAALSADAAYLDRDKELLAQENERYNILEDEAASLAQQLEEDPDVIVAAFYDAAIAQNVEFYEAERLKAGNADTFLRNYLGSDAQ